MARKLQTLGVDGIPVVGVKARFRNQFDVPLGDAYDLALDEDVVYVIFAKVGPPGTKETNSGMVRINALRVDEAHLISNEADRMVIRQMVGSLEPDHPQLHIDFDEPISEPMDVPVVIRTPIPEVDVAEVLTLVAEPRGEIKPVAPPEPQPESESPEREEVAFGQVPPELLAPDESGDVKMEATLGGQVSVDEGRVEYEEAMPMVPVVGSGGGVIVADARGQSARDPMLARFLQLERGDA